MATQLTFSILLFLKKFQNWYFNCLIYIVYIYSTPLSWAGCDTMTIFKLIKLVWIQFSFSLTGCLIKTLLFSLSWRRVDGFMPFSRTLAWREKQIASSGILTLVVDFLSYNDNRYVKRASFALRWENKLESYFESVSIS